MNHHAVVSLLEALPPGDRLRPGVQLGDLRAGGGRGRRRDDAARAGEPVRRGQGRRPPCGRGGPVGGGAGDEPRPVRAHRPCTSPRASCVPTISRQAAEVAAGTREAIELQGPRRGPRLGRGHDFVQAFALAARARPGDYVIATGRLTGLTYGRGLGAGRARRRGEVAGPAATGRRTSAGSAATPAAPGRCSAGPRGRSWRTRWPLWTGPPCARSSPGEAAGRGDQRRVRRDPHLRGPPARAWERVRPEDELLVLVRDGLDGADVRPPARRGPVHAARRARPALGQTVQPVGWRGTSAPRPSWRPCRRPRCCAPACRRRWSSTTCATSCGPSSSPGPAG